MVARGISTTMRSLTLLLVLFAAACAPAPDHPKSLAPSKPVVTFPTKAELAAVPTRPTPPDAFGKDAIAVREYSLVFPPGESLAAYDDKTRLGDVVRDVAAKKPEAVPSPELRCAANEMAKFVVQRRGEPTASLRRFLAGACGSVSVDPASVVWSGTAPRALKDDDIWRSGEAKLKEALETRLGRGRNLIGLGFARSGEQFCAIALVGRELARIDPASRKADANRRVLVRGEMRAPAEDVLLTINRGEFDAVKCERDPRVALPAFSFACTLAEGDSAAWAQLLVRRPGRLLLDSAADILVRADDAPEIAFRAVPSGPDAPVKTPQELTQAILAGLNEVRARARLGPVALAPRQSETNARVAGALEEAALKRDDPAADRIALGLLAGWDVDGLIRGGEFYVGVAPTHDARSWLDTAIAQPLGRMVLLDPAARQIAIGGLMPEGPQALGAVVTTYSFFESGDHRGDVERLFQRVAQARAARGLPPVRRVAVPELAEAASAVLEQGAQPMAVLDRAMQRTAARTQGMVNGMVLEANDLDRAEVPPELLAPGSPELALQVTHHRAPGGAWGQLVVFVVYLTPFR
jgi:hypothetical protein